jgi:hypothetical protein
MAPYDPLAAAMEASRESVLADTAADATLSAGDFVAGGLPVFTIASTAAKALGAKMGMSKDASRAFGFIVGAGASILTVFSTGTP